LAILKCTSKKYGVIVVMKFTWLGWGLLAGFCVYCNELLDSLKEAEFFDNISEYQLPKKDLASWI
jgi:hypothetical protein